MPDFQLVASGNFTSDGSGRDIAMRSDFDFFEAENHTQMATTQTPGRGIVFNWRRGYAADSAWMISKADALDTVTHEVITSGGFTRVNTALQAPEVAKVVTAVTAASPAVVTSAAHGYSTGDRIRMIDNTAMLQIGGYEFSVTNLTVNTFSLTFLDASGFAAAATAGFARRIPNPPIYAPTKNFITGVTLADPAVVTLSVTHGLAVGDRVKLHVSADYGMTQLDNLVGNVSAVNVANNTITLANVDSTAFDAFAFPTSAVAAGGVTQAHIVPFGTVSTNVEQALDNESQIVLRLGAGADGPAGSNGDVIFWRAWAAGHRQGG